MLGQYSRLTFRWSTFSHPEGRAGDSNAVQVARILDPIIGREKKTTAKEKKKKKTEFSKSDKDIDDAVQKAHRLAEVEAGKSGWSSPDSSDREEICRMMERHVLGCLLEEFVRS